MEMKFYRCETCGQIIAVIKSTGAPLTCCGKPMKELVPCTTDAAVEKHVPVCEQKDGKLLVSVGSVTHPMAPEHYIEWIALQTESGFRFAALKPGDEPKACFIPADGDKPVAAYAYCNLHGLWKN